MYRNRGGAYVEFQVDQRDGFIMIGLNSDPTTGLSYHSLDHVIYVSGYSSGAHIYENGMHIQRLGDGAYNQDTIFSIHYKDGMMRYYKDNVLVREINVGVGLTFYLDSSFFKGIYNVL